MTDSRRNAEGYMDMTAYTAIKRASRKPRKKYCPTESEEQIALFDWAELQAKHTPELKYLFHVPNGGLRNKATAARLKREGAKPGVPDIYLDVPRLGYHGLRIELKRMTGRVTDSQADWLNWLKGQGYFAVVAYGFDEARRFIMEYLGGE